jgi:PDZ domain-containing protein
MFNKIYSKIKEFIKENLVFFILPIIVFVVLSIPLPYYVEAPGGIISLNNKVNVVGGNNINGNINITYVSVYDGNVGTYFLSKFNKEWDLVPSTDVEVGTENRSDVKVRNKLLLDNSLSNAYYAVYNYLGKDLNLLSSNIHVLYIN